jgi:hypothetical protein
VTRKGRRKEKRREDATVLREVKPQQSCGWIKPTKIKKSFCVRLMALFFCLDDQLVKTIFQ